MLSSQMVYIYRCQIARLHMMHYRYCTHNMTSVYICIIYAILPLIYLHIPWSATDPDESWRSDVWSKRAMAFFVAKHQVQRCFAIDAAQSEQTKITEASVFRCRGCCSSLRWTSNFGSPTFLAFGQVARNSVRASAFATCAFRCPKKRIFSSQSCRFCEATYGVFICSTVGFHQQKGGWITSGSCLLNVTCNRPVMWFGFVKWQLKTAAIWWLTSGLGVARIWQSHIQEDSMISQTWWVWLEIVDLSPPFRMNHARNLRPTADPGKKTHDFIRLSTEWVSPMVGKA